MHSQVNSIKFVESWRYNIIFYVSYIIYIIYYISRVESNKFDNIYNKTGNVFVGSYFKKIEHVFIKLSNLFDEKHTNKILNRHIRRKI